MKFKTDKNRPIEVVDLLRNEGHDTLSVVDQQLAGHPDVEVSATQAVLPNSPVNLLNEAWQQFRAAPEGYRAWEKNAIADFLVT